MGRGVEAVVKMFQAAQLKGRIMGIPIDAMGGDFYARARAHTLKHIGRARRPTAKTPKARPAPQPRAVPAVESDAAVVERLLAEQTRRGSSRPAATATAPRSMVYERAFADEWSSFVDDHASTRPGSPLMFDHRRRHIWDLIDRDGFGTVNVHGDITDESAGRFALELDAIREGAAARERNRRPEVYEDDLTCSPRVPLLVNLDSPGGGAAASFAMGSMLARFSAETGPTIAFIGGQAASGAAIVALSASYAVADPWCSSLMVHWGSGGTAFEARLFKTRLRDLILDRTLLDEETARHQFLSPELVFDGHTAKDRGFVDQVGDIGVARTLAAAAAKPGGSVPRDGFRQRVIAERREDARRAARVW